LREFLNVAIYITLRRWLSGADLTAVVPSFMSNTNRTDLTPPPVSVKENSNICSLIAHSFGTLPNAPTFLDTLVNSGSKQFHRNHHFHFRFWFYQLQRLKDRKGSLKCP
jgi:hypothetical protein